LKYRKNGHFAVLQRRNNRATDKTILALLRKAAETTAGYSWGQENGGSAPGRALHNRGIK
jgi:hypothetical protein